ISSDEQAQRLGLMTASAAARERRPDAVLLPSRLRLRLASSASWRAISSDEQAQRLGLMTASAAARERRPDAVLLPSRL
ncbi:hypothetical protein C3E94_27970, partial [Klebsiella pneumoniae]